MSDLVTYCANSDLSSIATALQTAKLHLVDDTRHGLPWKEILQGMVTLCVGLFAGWIAWQQKEIARENKEISRENKETAKQKLKLEVFEKRMEIIKIIEEFYITQNDLNLFSISEKYTTEIRELLDNNSEKNNLFLDIYLLEPFQSIKKCYQIDEKIKSLFSLNTSNAIIILNNNLKRSYYMRLEYIGKNTLAGKKHCEAILNASINSYEDMWKSLRENEFKGINTW